MLTPNYTVTDNPTDTLDHLRTGAYPLRHPCRTTTAPLGQASDDEVSTRLLQERAVLRTALGANAQVHLCWCQG